MGGTPAGNTDPAPWTSKHGWKAVMPNLYDVPSSSQGWWRIANGGPRGGWEYSFDFQQEFRTTAQLTDLVRRRAWIRDKQPPASEQNQTEIPGCTAEQEVEEGNSSFFSCDAQDDVEGEDDGTTLHINRDQFLQHELQRALIASQVETN